MKRMTNDAARRTQTVGLALAVSSAACFGFSGPLARGLLEAGWTPGAVVLVRIAIGALVVAPFAVRALRGRWGLLRAEAPLIVAYGAAPIALAQFAYFSAVERMDVAPALLIEYTAPAAVVVWLWLRRGERPSATTLAGAAVAAVGLVLVLDLVSGADLAAGGVLWALVAMVGAASYFLLSAGTGSRLPPLALAGGGLAVAAVALAALGAIGVLPLRASTTAPVYAGRAVVWWLPLLGLGVVTAGVAYVLGIAAIQRLGSRVSSFVALLEVVFGVLAAWLLLDQLPAAVQLAGGALVVAGVVLVKLGERSTAPAATPENAKGPPERALLPSLRTDSNR
jgi:drug/metabolite transporter (DMT)-like permease